MHCPRCGADAFIGQQFCRSCGFNLEKVSELLAEQPPAVLDANLAQAHLRQRRFEHWAGIAGLLAMSSIFIAMICMIITQMMIKNGHVGGGLFLLIFIIGAAVMAGLQGYSKSLKQRLAQQNSASINDLINAAQAAKQLDPHREPAQSVTEHTTELLPAQPARRVDTREV